MPANSGNLFDSLPENKSQEVFDNLLQKGDISIERIVSFGQATPEGEWYDQETDEWVLLAQGQSMLLYESGEERSLKAGDYLFIPCHEKHRVTHTSEDAIWLAIHFQSE